MSIRGTGRGLRWEFGWGLVRGLAMVGALLAVPSLAVAWGSDGHRAIGEVASHYLTPEAAIAIAEFLEPGPYETLAAAGYWADAHARRFEAYESYNSEHFINVDPAETVIDLDRDCPQTCVLKAIERLRGEVVDPELPTWRRAEAFRFLVHFVEDLHQPLHVVHPDGRGGNLTAVLLDGEETNLHSLWDSGLIEKRLADFEPTFGTVESWVDWAYALRLSIEPEERSAWVEDMDPVAWATEVMEHSRRLTFDIEAGQEIDQAYYDTALPVVEEQIKKASVRLAQMLNTLFEE